jgi:hypothetical protein
MKFSVLVGRNSFGLEICAISTSASKKDIGRCFKQIVQNLPNSNRPESIDIKNLVVCLISNDFVAEFFLIQASFL